MIDLPSLAALAATHGDDLARPVAPLLIGERSYDTDAHPVLMGVVNLSIDSTYRESIATSTDSAIRKCRIQVAQGADCVDLGAESSVDGTARVDAVNQAAALVPVIKTLAAEDIAISVEGYDPALVRASLEAGARIINLTGAEHDAEIFDLVADHQATLLMCHVRGGNVRDVTDVTREADPFPELIEHFERRIADARSRGVDRIVIDPGVGFTYSNLMDPMIRAQHQTMMLLNTFRLRSLGLPVCHALPHAFDIFEEEFRIAEPFFAVLARLGGTGMLRTHEVPRARVVVQAMAALNPVST